MPLAAVNFSPSVSLTVDHTGVPPEWHDHLTTGYPIFYQQPLERYFAQDEAPGSHG